MTNEMVTVYWYEHDCPWFTKYCDEYHKKSAQITRDQLVALAAHQQK